MHSRYFREGNSGLFRQGKVKVGQLEGGEWRQVTRGVEANLACPGAGLPAACGKFKVDFDIIHC